MSTPPSSCLKLCHITAQHDKIPRDTQCIKLSTTIPVISYHQEWPCDYKLPAKWHQPWFLLSFPVLFFCIKILIAGSPKNLFLSSVTLTDSDKFTENFAKPASQFYIPKSSWHISTSFLLRTDSCKGQYSGDIFQLHDSSEECSTNIHIKSSVESCSISAYTAAFLHNYTCQSFKLKWFEPLEKWCRSASVLKRLKDVFS